MGKGTILNDHICLLLLIYHLFVINKKAKKRKKEPINCQQKCLNICNAIQKAMWVGVFRAKSVQQV